jgi:copper chaperone CopZ
VLNALEPLQVAADNISVNVATKTIIVRVDDGFDPQKIVDALKARYPRIQEAKSS